MHPTKTKTSSATMPILYNLFSHDESGSYSENSPAQSCYANAMQAVGLVALGVFLLGIAAIILFIIAAAATAVLPAVAVVIP